MMRSMLQTLLSHPAWYVASRIALAAAYLSIALASLVPKNYRPQSGLVPGAIEHLAAYAVLGLLAAFILRSQASWWALALFNTAFAGGLEVAQLWTTGRVANVTDFAASALGSLAGILFVEALCRVRPR